MAKEMIAMLLAGGQGSRLYALTQKLAKPAVPFGGKYRIIDFPLSNCVNSGIDTVGILTQYQPLVLNEYIGNGQPWDLDRLHGGVHVLPPYQQASGSDWYKGTANAIYQNISFIERYNPQYVIILSGDQICKQDYSDFLRFHKEKGAESLPECGALDPARDRQEMLMAKWSRSAGKPALGICRGCQVMNVAAGGTLVQDIASTYHISKDVHSQPEDYAVTTHWVDLVPGTLAADVMGCEEVRVNSRHHQCVKDLAPGMVLDGRSRDDGIIESFHDPKHPFYLAVQWHPEMLSADRPEALALFEALVRKSQEIRDQQSA